MVVDMSSGSTGLAPTDARDGLRHLLSAAEFSTLWVMARQDPDLLSRLTGRSGIFFGQSVWFFRLGPTAKCVEKGV